MSTDVHPSAIVDSSAELGEGVSVGPFSVIGPNVKIGDGAVIRAHAVIDGHTTLGEGVEIFPFAAVGLPPQDRKYDGSPTELRIGARTVIRECTTLQPGTVGTGIGHTEVGADCLIMAYVHIAHDCVVGNNVIIANSTQLAGHVTVEDDVVLGGMTSLHQFVRVGTRAFTGAATRVAQDIPPYMLADGHPAHLFGLNSVGLDRAGFSAEAKKALKQAYRLIFVRGPYQDGIKEAKDTLSAEHPEVERLCTFLESSHRGVTRGRTKRR